MGQQRIRQLQRQAATPTAAPPAQKPFSWQRPFPVPEQNTVTSAPQPIPDLQARLEILRRANPDWSKVKASSNPAKAVQAKLTVGAPNDQYEQEADRVADQVMSMPDAATQSPVQREGKHEEDELQAKPLAATITPLVQREAIPEEEDPVQKKASGNADIQREEIPEEEEVLTKPLSSGTLQREEMPEEHEELQMKSLGTTDLQREEMPEEHEELQMKSLGTADLQRTARPEDDESLQPKSFPTPDTPHPIPSLETQLSNSQGSGSPLPNDVRSFMEPRFGADFSQVRVHTGSEAVQMNRDLNAQAFTHKQDVYFGAGKTPAKDSLTAHELTHVVQQAGGDSIYRQEVSSSEAEQEKQRIQELKGNYNQAVTNKDWHATAVLLNAFNEEDIRNKLQKLKSRYGAETIKSIHQCAVDDSSVGSQSQVALITDWFLSTFSTKTPETLPSIGSSNSDSEASEIVHTALDVLGLIPVVGEFADGANVCIYALEGDWLNAGISAAAMIPVLGAGAILAKGVVKIETATVKRVGKKGIKAAIKAGKKAGKKEAANIVKSSKGVKTHLHHLFPQEFFEDFRKLGIDVDDFVMELRVEEHIGKEGVHLKGDYNGRWQDFFDEAENSGRKLTKKDAENYLTEILNDLGLAGRPIGSVKTGEINTTGVR